MRASYYNAELDKYEICRLFMCLSCYQQLLETGQAEDENPTLTEEDAGYECGCEGTTEG